MNPSVTGTEEDFQPKVFNPTIIQQTGNPGGMGLLNSADRGNTTMQQLGGSTDSYG